MWQATRFRLRPATGNLTEGWTDRRPRELRQTLVVALHNHAEAAKERIMERISIRNLSFVEGDVGVVEGSRKREINKLGWVKVR